MGRRRTQGPLGPTAIQQYLDSGRYCPYCHSANISSEDPEPIDCRSYHVAVSCGNCDEYWSEFHEMTAVGLEETDPGGIPMIQIGEQTGENTND